MLSKGKIIKLSNDTEYVIVSTLLDEGNFYVYLVNLKDEKDVMFCKYEDNKLNKIIESDLIEKLLLLFSKEEMK